jgi:glycosyltransferase involved in cell wall biosynthesis
MIVRNEAAVIERCLDAARPAIDAVSICDTGSTDDTIARIREWLSRAGIPGRVHHDPFVNFAVSRTRSLERAVETIRDLGWKPDETYLLLLDADMVLEVSDNFRRDALSDDVYAVAQQNGALRYLNVRLVRSSVPGRFIGATHEYFDSPPGTTTGTLRSLTIDDRNDGGSRGDKYERDRRLLEEELARDPANPRAMFYLAQTYRGMGNLPKSLAWYRRRTEAGGWDEEAWYAQYSVGLVFLDAGDDRAAFRAFATALRRDPRRPEPYFHLATLLRARKHTSWATNLARAGLSMGMPMDRALFIDRDIVNWGFARELSIAAFTTPHYNEGLDANERLALGAGAPPDLSWLASQNALFYLEPLPTTEHIAIRPSLPPPYRPCNPSILRTDDGYRLNCRGVSYQIDDGQAYTALEPDGILRTRNMLMRLDRALKLVDEREIVAEIPPIRPSVVQGLEDCRLFRAGGRFGLTCTSHQFHPADYVRMSVVTLSDSGDLRHHAPITGYHDELTQKNWLPFADPQSEDLLAIYSYEPFVVVRIDPETGSCVPIVERPQGRNFDLFRGSAGPIDLPEELGGGRLVIVHHVSYQHMRYYLHRFLHVDADWQVVGASRPFFFRKLGIEFAAGACWSHDGDLLITFGVNDAEAWLCRVSVDALKSMLRPLPDDPMIR